MALDKSILKSPIKIISLDSSQTESIIQTNLSTQFAGSDGLRYKKPTRMGEDFFIFTSSHTHSIPYSSYRVRRLNETSSLIYTMRPVSFRSSASFLIIWKPAIETSLSSMWSFSLDSEKQNIWKSRSVFWLFWTISVTSAILFMIWLILRCPIRKPCFSGQWSFDWAIMNG